MNLFLIRHAESVQNTGETKQTKVPDHEVYLTEKGKTQATDCGLFLKNFCKVNNLDLQKSLIFTSPYVRTRQTTTFINQNLNIEKVVEDILLIEIQFGVFDNEHFENYEKLLPVEGKYFNQLYNSKGRFFAKFPQGESIFDVAVRTRLFLQQIEKAKNNGVENVFIVSHGFTLKALLLCLFNKPYEWFFEEKKLENCGIKLIEITENNLIDKGVIYN